MSSYELKVLSKFTLLVISAWLYQKTFPDVARFGGCSALGEPVTVLSAYSCSRPWLLLEVYEIPESSLYLEMTRNVKDDVFLSVIQAYSD